MDTSKKLQRIQQVLRRSRYPHLASDAERLKDSEVFAIHEQISQNENAGRGPEIIEQHVLYDVRQLLMQGNKRTLYCKEFLN
jgi:hypothetical protein